MTDVRFHRVFYLHNEHVSSYFSCLIQRRLNVDTVLYEENKSVVYQTQNQGHTYCISCLFLVVVHVPLRLSLLSNRGVVVMMKMQCGLLWVL